ncbi:MAG TPA: hypothetical protein VL283_04585 [Candidatus Baltobacteraceae bacterium]|nr:hypothetical protein [Candidatus Baltobacteraceae bacterium]
MIYTIPDQFYGLAAKAQLPREIAAPAPAAPGVPAAPTAPVPLPAEKKGSNVWVLIPIAAVLLLGGIGFGIWMLMKPKKPAAPAAPTVTLPQPQPQPEPEPEPQPEPEPATTTQEVPPPSLSDDTDGDGLTNAEETLFGTDAAKADSDDDGFSDSVEVTNLYNPAGFRPTKLIEAGLVKEYVSTRKPFAALYPSKWSFRDSDAGFEGTMLLIVSSDVGDARFTVEDGGDLGGQSLLDAYLTRNPGASPSQTQSFTTKSGLEGVRSSDGMTAYIALDGGFLIVRHEAGGQALYASTFTMFLNSFSKNP